MIIEYKFIVKGGETFTFEVDTRRPAEDSEDTVDLPFWTKLDFHKCSNCTLSETEHEFCPAALDAKRITQTFKDMLSTEEVRVEVTTPDRTYVKNTDSQTGLRALFGLVMATSGCPILSRFKGMADTHLPFATMEETILRVAGSYLIKQYLVHREGGVPDWEFASLNSFYEQIQEVNRCFKSRIDSASKQDANMNALGSLVYLAMGVSFSLEDKLSDLEGMVFSND
ncbi:MAG: hypothetical protein ISQ14_04335 [Verrucomicrobiae bacterium]|nr:hypothetical protein [Verrucomicrobiae bacterium]